MDAEVAVTPAKSIKMGFLHRTILQATAIFFWLYLILKLFVFDFDVYLASTYFPQYAWLLVYKFFFLIGLIAVVWFFTKSRYVLIWFLYISFYPLVVVFFNIPFFVFKRRSWVLAFAITNSLISFIKTLKYKFIMTALFCISVLGVAVVSEKFLIGIAITIIFVILCITYIRSVLLIFKPSAIFEIYSGFVLDFLDKGKEMYSLDSEIKNLPVQSLTQKQLEMWVSRLQIAIIYNRGCYFVAKKLQDYQSSKFNFLSYSLNLFFITFTTVIAFAVINYALFKINSGYFIVTNPSFFYFFYYSFSAFTFSSISEISAITPISQMALIVERFFALFLGMIFVTLIFSTKGERYNAEINDVVAAIKRRGDEMNIFIQDEYKLTFEQAMKELERLKAGMLNLIYQLTKNLD